MLIGSYIIEIMVNLVLKFWSTKKKQKLRRMYEKYFSLYLKYIERLKKNCLQICKQNKDYENIFLKNYTIYLFHIKIACIFFT